jgi:chromosome segregation ATPase
MSHHHLLKNLWHGITQFFKPANTTVHKILADPNLGNKIKVAGFVKKGIEELIDYAESRKSNPEQGSSADVTDTSKEDTEIIEGFKAFFKEVSEKQEQIDKKLINLNKEFNDSQKDITQLQDEVKKQKGLNTNLQLHINTIENSYDESKKQIQELETKQKLRDKQLIFAFSLLLVFVISIGYLLYKLYNPD